MNATPKTIVGVPAIANALLVVIGVALIPGFAARPVGNPQDADSYIVMGFGLRIAPNGQVSAGESNRAIARHLLDLNEGGKPAIVQYGVFLALDELRQEGADLPGRGLDWVVVLPHHNRFHVDTRAAGLQSLALLHHLGRSRPALIAHPDQLKRVAFIFRHLPLSEPFIVPETPRMPYGRRSTQRWTRSRPLYCAFELLVSRPRSLLETFLF